MKISTISFLLSLITLSCHKENRTSSSTIVEYQLTCTNSTGQMQVAYNNKDAQYVSGLYSDGWKTSFTPNTTPFTATLKASLFTTYPLTVTLKILVDGVVKQETTGTINIPGNCCQQIQYTIP